MTNNKNKKPIYVADIQAQHQEKFKQIIFTQLKLESNKKNKKDQFVNTNRHLYNTLWNTLCNKIFSFKKLL